MAALLTHEGDHASGHRTKFLCNTLEAFKEADIRGRGYLERQSLTELISI